MIDNQTDNAKPARDLLDPKNDYVFKRLFVRAPRLLVALINAVRHAEPPIRAVIPVAHGFSVAMHVPRTR
jgi:hypothetical protein